MKMGIKFGEESGSAKKKEFDYIKLEFGENRVRLVGNILPRYCYWKKVKTTVRFRATLR
jgi:hypothetical protein